MKISAIIKLIIISLIAILIICGCEIEEKIDKAAERCEDKISKVLEGVEDICLTKEEILELINSIEQPEGAGDTFICEEDTVP
tara:strand:- start:369 stop:617 length:249 start_codon:yes stop_codon:yes gene_type:complete